MTFQLGIADSKGYVTLNSRIGPLFVGTSLMCKFGILAFGWGLGFRHSGSGLEFKSLGSGNRNGDHVVVSCRHPCIINQTSLARTPKTLNPQTPKTLKP